MIKIEVYPFVDCLEGKCLSGTEDVDFTSLPSIYILLGWVMGVEYKFAKYLEYRNVGYDRDMDVYKQEAVKMEHSSKHPCLKAIVEIAGVITEIEHYRVKILKED